MMKKIISICLVALFLISAGCSRKIDVPVQSDALDQFFYAMDTFYRPANHAKGAEQKKLIKNSVIAFQTVLDQFSDIEPLVFMETNFYQGKCLYELEDFEMASKSFYACFNVPVTAKAVDAAEADMMGYKDDAWQYLMTLQEYLSADEELEVELYAKTKR